MHLFGLFPTCQVRVVRFYQSCSPPPPLRLAVLLLLLVLLLFQFLLGHVCINFHLHFRLCQLFAKLFANSLRQALCQLPSSVCTAGPQPGTFPAQCAPLDLNLGPPQLSVHRWTSTWDLPSSVCTAGPQPGTCSSVCAAGPQPGTCPAQCAPLDLNRGPSQLSVHRWTSTWDLPNSVCTAGPQPPDRMPEDMPDRMPDRMPENMPEHMPDRMPEDMPEHMPEDMPDRMPDKMPEDMSEYMPEDMPDRMPEDMPDRMPEDLPDRMPENLPDRMPENMPEDMPDKMPEGLPVSKCINVMVGITRSKVFFLLIHFCLAGDARDHDR